MIEQLSQMQARLQNMRDGLLKEGSVVPGEGYVTTNLEAKRKVLWHLDRLAAAVAGTHQHLSNIEHDDIFSATEQAERQRQIFELLRQDLGWIPGIIKSMHRLNENFVETDEPPLTREDVAEWQQTLDQLHLLDRQEDDMLGELDAYIASLA